MMDVCCFFDVFSLICAMLNADRGHVVIPTATVAVRAESYRGIYRNMCDNPYIMRMRK